MRGKRRLNIRLDNIYYGMTARCHNPKDDGYQKYGARGIKVCEEWLNDKQAFIIWSLSNGYSDELTLDRINNSEGYSPTNCRWASVRDQANNRRTNHLITINGDTHTISEWSRISGIRKSTLRERIIRGESGEDLLKPTRIYARKGKE